MFLLAPARPESFQFALDVSYCNRKVMWYDANLSTRDVACNMFAYCGRNAGPFLLCRMKSNLLPHEHPLNKRTSFEVCRRFGRSISPISHLINVALILASCSCLLFHLSNLPGSHKPQENSRPDVHPPSEQYRARVASAIESYDLKPDGFGNCVS